MKVKKITCCSLFKLNILLAFFVVLTILFSSFISADVISINSGGTGNIILNPDRYVEGFFFGGICGDGVVDTGLGEQCDDGNTVDGDGCSSTCQIEEAEEPTEPSDGGGGAVTPSANLKVEPTEFNINLAVNTNTERTISVTNLETTTQTIFISQTNLDNRVILGETNLTIEPEETETFNVIFVATNETGIFTGKILVGGYEVLVSLNVQTELLLFDSNIVVLNPNYQVEQGGDLETLVTLIPFGEDPRLDVTLNFVIKDYANNNYLTKSETLLVTEQINLRRDFSTGKLPLGDYIIGLELIYPNGVAPSSAYFEVVERIPTSIFGRLVLFLIILILIILIIIIIIYIKRKLDERKQQTGSYF